ncbi:core protein [Atlantic halibut reovirus]|nr:core protein [Atlantic halibut reovirus]
MARRDFVGLTPNFHAQQLPLFTNNDYLALGGTATRPWQNRTANLSINAGGYPVWAGDFPTVACRQLILDALIGSHVSQFSGGLATQYAGVSWRDRIMSSFTIPIRAAPPVPPVWNPAGSVHLDSANYPEYALNFEVMWPINQDIHMMSLWSLSDVGPIIMLERPVTNIPTMVFTSMLSYVGMSAIQLSIQAYTYSGQLAQPPNAIQAQVYQWLACILFGSLTGRLHRNRTCEGFYFAFSKPGDNQDEASLRWNDGLRTGVPINGVTRFVACGSPHWQQSMLHVSFAMLAHSTSCLRAIPALVSNNRLPPYSRNVPGLSGGGQGARDFDRYNYRELALVRHLEWENGGLITQAVRLEYDDSTNIQSVAFIRHLNRMEALHPLANGRIVVKPFNIGDVANVFETGAVVQAADAMFP